MMKDKQFAEELYKVIELSSNIQKGRINSMIGLKLRDCDRESGIIEYDFTPEDWCLNPYNGVHGGIIASVFDFAVGMPALVVTQQFVTTTDLSVTYLRPMTAEKFIVRIELTHVGRRIVNSVGKIFEEGTGRLCATGQVNYIVTGEREKGIEN